MELPPALHRNLVVESGCRVIGSDHGALHAILCIDAVLSCAVCHPVSPSCRLEVLTGLSSRAARDGVLGRSSDRRPRTGGARREHRHACGARRDARRRARRGRRGRLALGVGTRRRTCARARARAHAHAPRSTPLRCAIGNEESIECPLPGPAARRARACGRAREDWCKRREMLPFDCW